MNKTSVSTKGPLYHLCKVSHDGSLVFYSPVDILVFVTVLFSYAARYGIVVTELCIMLNHFHLAVYGPSEEKVKLFYAKVCSRFASLYNSRDEKVKIKWLSGANISKKQTVKMKQTAYIYLANNALHKKGCKKAVEYKWNFLERAVSGGKKTVRRKGTGSKELILAKAIVRDTQKAGRPLDYKYFDHYKTLLVKDEWRELVDYILEIYIDINYEDIIGLFGSIDSFLAAADTFSGADFDVNDDFSAENYIHYREMTVIMKRRGLSGNDAEIHKPGFDPGELVRALAFETAATNVEISRFLHVPLEVVQNLTCRKY